MKNAILNGIGSDNMDAFDKAFVKCNKKEQEQILSLTPEEFAQDLLKSLKKKTEDK